MAGQDYYATLGVAKTATEKEIKAAFRKLARKYHPDVNPGDAAAEERFKEINEAYEVLSNTENRAKYDKYGKNWKHADQFEAARQAGTRNPGGHRARSRATTFDFDDILSQTQGDEGGGGFGDMFDRLFRQDSGRRSGFRNIPGEDLEHQTEITLEEAFTGATRILEVTSEDRCPMCGGTGRTNNKACPECFGTGTVRRPKRLEVKIPAGVATGSRVRVAGEGSPSIGGGPKGDLYLAVSVRPHPAFERKGDDLYEDVEVPMISAVLGGEALVPTIKGRVALKIPAETQNGRVFRLGGQGMPKLGDPTKRGDLYAKVKVVLPTNLTEKQRSLFEQLRESMAR